MLMTVLGHFNTCSHAWAVDEWRAGLKITYSFSTKASCGSLKWWLSGRKGKHCTSQLSVHSGSYKSTPLRALNGKSFSAQTDGFPV